MKHCICVFAALVAASLFLLSCQKEPLNHYEGDISAPVVSAQYDATVEVFLTASQGEPAAASAVPGTVEVTVTASVPVPCKVLVRDSYGNTHVLLRGSDSSTYGSVPEQRYGHYESITPKCTRVIPAEAVIDGVRYVFKI